MLGRPVTASTIPPMPPERMVSAKVQVVSVPLQPIAVCSSGIAGQRQTTDDSTTSTLASFERDFSGGNDSVEILLRLSQVDKKLEEMTGLMYSCLEGIESVKNARHGSANDDDDNKSSRPSSSQTQATNVSEPLPVNAEPARAWDDGAPVDFDDSPPNSVCRQDSHLNDDAWARPVQPIATPSQSGGGWRGMKTGFGDLMNRTLSSRQSDHEMPDPLNDNDSELSPNTRKRRASLVLVEKALSMFQEGRSPRVDAVWTFLEEGDSSRGAKIWTRVWCSFVCATVLLTLSQTLGPSAPLSGIIVVVLETMVEISFLVELIARLVTCPDMRHFLTSAFNLIDMASAMPLVLRMSNGFSPVATTDAASDPVYFVLLCVVPVIRLLKILRKEQLQLQLFEAVMDSVTESLQFLGFVGMCIVLVFAAMVFLVEPRDNIESFAHACWLVIVTMTTVGYGDVSPVTDRGRLIIAALVITSALYMALPIGVLGNAFAAVWKDRDLILLIEKTRRRLAQWGYTAVDIPTLFHRFDIDGDGELDLSEFRIFMKELRVNLKDERIVDLFEIFDKDRGGSIDDKEFLHVIFPRIWHDMVQKEKEEEEAKEAREKEERERKEKERKERRKRRASVDSGLSPRPSHSAGSRLRSPRPIEDNLVHNLVEGDTVSTPARVSEPAFLSKTLVVAPRAPCPAVDITLDKNDIQPTSFFAFSGKEVPWSRSSRPDILVDEA